MLATSEIQSKFRDIRARIDDACRAAGRDPRSVALIAVAKTHPAEAVRALLDLGQRDFAENYVQELAGKAGVLELEPNAPRWHFIGHLQSNKIKALLPWISALHTIDTLKLADAVSKRVLAGGTPHSSENPLPVLLQVNIDRETTKSGVFPEEALEIAREVARLPGIRLQGLMCIPAEAGTAEGSSDAFYRTHELAKSLARLGILPTDYWLSMGMTSDFEQAIRHGATHVRIGTAIFGEREKRTK